MRSQRFLLMLALHFPLIAASKADEPNLARLVSFDDLEKRLEADGSRLIDVRSRGDYDEGHLPGAMWVDVKEVEATASAPNGLTDPKPWEAWVADLGITSETDVLIYDAKRQLDAARLWWILTYLGVKHVGLIDGNYALWKSEHRPTSMEVPSIASKPFKVDFQAERLATRLEVLAAVATKSAAIVDARSAGEHTGEVKRSKRGGRIPSACSVEWAGLIDMDGRFLDEKGLRAKLEKAGGEDGGTGDLALSRRGPRVGRCVRPGTARLSDSELLRRLVGLGECRRYPRRKGKGDRDAGLR